MPVVIDDTRDDDERVPERFREVQWTRLPGGVTPEAFVDRVRRLLSGELSQEPTRTASAVARVPTADAQSARAKMRATQGDASAFQYAQIYAQWGDTQQALRWLDLALRLRDSGLGMIKVDPLLDPLRKEPRFQAIERELKFPS